MSDRFRVIVDRFRVTPGRVAIGGLAVAVLALLANNPGLAIVIASLVIPAAALVELSRRDLFEHEPQWSSLAMLGWGAMVGIVMATIGSMVAAQWWIDGALLHVGAAGFGGEAAARAGSPGFLVLLFNGILLPAVGLSVATIGAYSMRRFPGFRNEVMDGVTLGAAVGCGLATGTTIVYVWPIISGQNPNGGSVADWTAMLIGVLVTRPVIFGLAVGFICAGVWHAAISQRSIDLVLSVGIGLGGAILFVFGDLLVQPRGTRTELFWHVIVVVGLGAAASVILARAIARDRHTLLAGGTRVICPSCNSVTPSGTYCAVCGGLLAGRTDLDVPAEEYEIILEPQSPDEQNSAEWSELDEFSDRGETKPSF